MCYPSVCVLLIMINIHRSESHFYSFHESYLFMSVAYSSRGLLGLFFFQCLGVSFCPPMGFPFDAAEFLNV